MKYYLTCYGCQCIRLTNPRLEEELAPFLNTPDKFAKDYEDYLEKLSELDGSGVLSPETHHLMKYLSTDDLVDKCQVFQEIIEFKDLLRKGVENGVFTHELLTNCLNDISKAFDNLNLSEISSKSRKNLLLDSLDLKSRYPDFDTHVSTLEELSINYDRELALGKIGNPERNSMPRSEFRRS